MQAQPEAACKRYMLREILQPHDIKSYGIRGDHRACDVTHSEFILSRSKEILIDKAQQCDFKLQYKYGTIYRDVLRAPNKMDFCYWMRNLDKIAKERPMANQLLKIFNDSVPGFFKPCPWKVRILQLYAKQNSFTDNFKEIHLENKTIETGSLMSVWPSGDYKGFWYSILGTGEVFLNVTLVGSLISPLKESFG